MVLFGRDQRGRPHAARFGAEDASLAGHAAELTGLKVLRVTAEHLPVTAALPQGRVFASGKAFVPFVREEAYKRIALAAGLLSTGEAGEQDAPAKPADGPAEPEAAPEAAAAPTPDPASGPLAVGAVVLACEGHRLGWYEAIVQGTKAPGLYELSWRDWPLDPRILRRVVVLAQVPAAMAWQNAPRG